METCYMRHNGEKHPHFVLLEQVGFYDKSYLFTPFRGVFNFGCWVWINFMPTRFGIRAAAEILVIFLLSF